MSVGGRFIGGIRFGVSMDTRKLNRDVKKSRMLIKGFTGQASRMLGVFTGAAGVTGVLLKAGQSYESLNKSMNRSLAIMGDVSKTMRHDMRRAAIDLSAEVNASASQIADSYFYLASAGLNAEQSLKALPVVAKFGQAGNFDLALATDLLTDAQSALGLTVKDTTKNIRNMTRVSDVLVRANTLANATVQQFSESLTNKAGAALRLVGKDIEEGVAVLAAFADQGIKGAEAGTGFGIVLRDLQTKAIKFESEFKKAGVSVFDSGGEMRNMASIIGDLEDKMVGLSDQAKKTFLLDLGFSDKSVAFVQALVGVSDKIKDYESALRNADGATKSVAGSMLTDLEKSTNKLSAAFQRLSENMAPIVGQIADLIEGVNYVSEVGYGQATAEGLGLRSAKVHTDPTMASIYNQSEAQREAERRASYANFPGLYERGQARKRNLERRRKYEAIMKREREAQFASASGVFRGLRSGVTGFLGGQLESIKQTASGVASNPGNQMFVSTLLPMLQAMQATSGISPKRAASSTMMANRDSGRLSLAQAGSAEAYRQNARIRSEKHRDKTANQHLREAKKTNQHLARMSSMQEAKI